MYSVVSVPATADRERLCGTYIVRTTSAYLMYAQHKQAHGVDMESGGGGSPRVYLLSCDGDLCTEASATTTVVQVDKYPGYFNVRRVA